MLFWQGQYFCVHAQYTLLWYSCMTLRIGTLYKSNVGISITLRPYVKPWSKVQKQQNKCVNGGNNNNNNSHYKYL
jgi:hypothetical protein